jgi:hypothetical protein
MVGTRGFRDHHRAHASECSRAGIFGGFVCASLAALSHLRAEPNYRESTTSTP